MRGRAPHVLFVFCLLLAAVAGQSHEIRWDQLQKERRVAGGTVLPPEPGSSFYRLRVDGAVKGRTVTVLTIDRPKIDGPQYALTGHCVTKLSRGLVIWNYGTTSLIAVNSFRGHSPKTVR